MEDAPTVDQSLGDPIANFEGGQIPTNETKKVDKPKGAASSPNIDIWERSPEGERVSYKEKLAGNASFETCPTKSKNPDAYGEEGRQCGTYGNKPAGKETVWKTTDSSHADNTPTIIRPEVTEGKSKHGTNEGGSGRVNNPHVKPLSQSSRFGLLYGLDDPTKQMEPTYVEKTKAGLTNQGTFRDKGKRVIFSNAEKWNAMDKNMDV
nr:hypothetical protein Iba_chr13aCG4760 [Ipomoea batatas]